jgi:hypothetical protein
LYEIHAASRPPLATAVLPEGLVIELAQHLRNKPAGALA